MADSKASAALEDVLDRLKRIGSVPDELLAKVKELGSQINEDTKAAAEGRTSTAAAAGVWSVFPWAALFTLIGGIATALLTGVFDVTKNRDTQSNTYNMKDLEYQYSAFEQLINIDAEQFKDDAARDMERKARICLAALFGLVDVPPYIVGVDLSNIKEYSANFTTLMNQRYECDKVGTPKTFTAPPPTTTPSTACPSDVNLASNRLPIPDGLASKIDAKSAILKLALGELNSGVHEFCQPERVAAYWNSVGETYTGLDSQVPWSAAFLSFLINGASNPRGLELSPNTSAIWSSAVSQQLTYLPLERVPSPGDLIFVRRSGPGNNLSMDDVRQGKRGWLGASGVVYSVAGTQVTYIGGNIDNMVSFRTIEQSDPSIVGYVDF
jgi:hypothetical protein